MIKDPILREEFEFTLPSSRVTDVKLVFDKLSVKLMVGFLYITDVNGRAASCKFIWGGPDYAFPTLSWSTRPCGPGAKWLVRDILLYWQEHVVIRDHREGDSMPDFHPVYESQLLIKGHIRVPHIVEYHKGQPNSIRIMRRASIVNAEKLRVDDPDKYAEALLAVTWLNAEAKKRADVEGIMMHNFGGCLDEAGIKWRTADTQ